MTGSVHALQLDYLKELFNLGLGHAAEDLEQMLSRNIVMTIPDADIVPNKIAMKRMSVDPATQLVAVRQTLRGDITGEAVLFFEEQKSLGLVRHLLLDGEMGPFSELDEDALIDVTNVIISGINYTFSQMLNCHVENDIPEAQHGTFDDLFSRWFNVKTSEQMGLYLSIGFSIQGQDVDGRIAFFQTLSSLERFLGRITLRLEEDGLL